MSMLQAALDYLAQGWSVFPVRGKKPFFEWGEFAERKPTVEEVRRWWTANPDANIALATGRVSNVVVVDVDTYKGADPHVVYDKHRTGRIARTGRNGFHLFYRYPPDSTRVANRVGKDGIDVRGDGGYVVLPPSRHENGKSYVWQTQGDLGECPDWVLDNETGAHQPKENWLTAMLGGLNEGNRNDSCARLAGYFAEKGMARDVALALCNQWDANNTPPLGPKEVETTVFSVYRKAFRNTKPPTEASKGPKTFNVMPLSLYMSRYGDAAVTWAIEDWMPMDTIVFVVSPPGSYKTWAVLDLAVSIASGLPFLSRFPVLTEPGPVLLIQQEDYHGQVAERIGVVAASKFNLSFEFDPLSEDFRVPNPPALPIFVHPDRALRFSDAAVMATLEEKIAAIRPKLCIIDPLYSAGDTSDYMAKTAEEMFPLKRMRDKYGCTFLIVHHTKKTTEGVTTREAAWGSQFLNAFLETGWQLRPMSDEGGNVVAALRHFKVKGALPPIKLTFDISTDFPQRYIVTSEEIDETKITEKSRILELVESKGPMTPTEISEELKVHRSTISRKLINLVKNGALCKREDGKFSIPMEAPPV